MRVLALDYGSARCGCALSDPTGTLATPIEPVLRPATRKGFARVCRPRARARGERSSSSACRCRWRAATPPRRAEARAFAQRLAERVSVPVELYDERFTTLLASRDPGDPRTSEDSRAAAHLLEGWLAARTTPTGRVALTANPRAA